ncbi:hypothetical protein H2248_002016 [Termitomyces sp. 'cryptogamus']|nr:hypothetical protein H2248_002016 [Termitomyces sp. 'cryptogamus']
MTSQKLRDFGNPWANFKTQHDLRSQRLNTIPKGWCPGHWYYSRLALLLSLLYREIARHELARHQYLELLNSLERCKARANAKSICIPRLDRFLQDVDQFRSDPSLRLFPDPNLFSDITCSLEKFFGDLDVLQEQTRKRGGLVIEDCPEKLLCFVKELPGAPNKFPRDLLCKMKIMIHIADICYSELTSALRPTLPKEEILLLAELRYADYQYRSERILARHHGGLWPEEGITMSARRRTDVDFFFKDPEDMMVGIEHIISTESAGIGCEPEARTLPVLKDSDL